MRPTTVQEMWMETEALLTNVRRWLRHYGKCHCQLSRDVDCAYCILMEQVERLSAGSEPPANENMNEKMEEVFKRAITEWYSRRSKEWQEKIADRDHEIMLLKEKIEQMDKFW